LRWRRLLLVVEISDFLPLVVAFLTGKNILRLLIAWGLIVLIGAAGAGPPKCTAGLLQAAGGLGSKSRQQRAIEAAM
jgi:hypothetical protein